MANYYTDFSVLLPMKDGITEKDIQKFLDSLPKSEEEAEEYLDLPSYEIESGQLWIHNRDESGNELGALWIIQEYLKKFDIKGAVFFTYSYTCSKPRVNEFSGGAYIVSQNDYLYTDSWKLLDEAREAGIEILNI